MQTLSGSSQHICTRAANALESFATRYSEAAAQWEEICDAAPQFEQWAPKDMLVQLGSKQK